MTPISVTVDYSLSEYLQVVETYLPYEITGRKLGQRPWEVLEPEVNLSGAARWLVRVVATGAFVYKVNRVGICSFVFTERGLVRKSKASLLEVPWGEVKRVLRLPVAFLVVKQNGALPIPYSSLTSHELQSLEALFSSVGHRNITNAA